MSDQTIDLQTCSLSMDDSHIVQLHIYQNQILEPEKIHEIFDTIHEKFTTGKTLLVTADNKATLSPDARELVSAGNVTDQILADAIVTKHYSHQMAANFFVRFNHPQRPTKLFKTEEEAREWLRTF